MRTVVCRLLLVFLVLVAARLCAQNAAFEKITIEQGLSQGMIFDILQTRDGFLWVATKDGLNRYDGYNFKVFSHDPYDVFSLADDNAKVLFEDSRGWMWVGTASKGVDVYNPQTGLFHHVNPHFSSEEQVAFMCPRTFVEDRSGAIWVQYDYYGLVRVSIPESWRQKGLPQVADLGRQTEIVRCSVAGWQPDREYWINMWAEPDGAITAFSSHQKYRVMPDAKAVVIPHSGLWPNLIYSVEPDERIGRGGFWLLGELGRVYAFRNGKLSFSQTPNLDWEGKTYSVQRDGEGNRWLLLGPKIWRLDPAKPLDFAAPSWTLDQEAKCIDTDRNGNLWVGTAGYGLRRSAPRFAAFHTGVAGQSIWRLWRSPKGPYYWRSASDVYQYDPVSGKPAATQAFPELADYWVRDLAFEASGAFWLLAAYRSNRDQMLLCRYSPNGQLEKCHTLPIRDYNYACFLRAQNGDIWINGAGCQLTQFTPQSAQIVQYFYAHLFAEKGPSIQAFANAEDGNGTLWIGTQQGLVQCLPTSQGMDFRLFQTNIQDREGLSHNNVSCLLPDPTRPDKVLWIGTKGGGINRLDIPTGRFLHYGWKDGLPDRVVYGILPGNEPPATNRVSLWCSTNQGIAKLIPLINEAKQDGKIPFSVVTYTAAKGLQDNEFNTQAYYKSAQGELLFGGINGLNHFFPEQLRPDTFIPSVLVVGLEVNHQTALPSLWNSNTTSSLEYLRTLHLHHHQNNVSFEFAVLDFTDPSKNRYRYRLVGLDADWVENGTHRFAHFTHLAPGRYTFLVQGSNGESQWADLAAPIELVISPPWYRSNFAYLCYLMLLAWGAWRGWQFQIKRVKEREQLAFEHREMERVKALEQLKTNFFSNVTHEFRTPLTLMLEPLRIALLKIKDPEALENVRLAEANSRKLLGLVNQLLDMAKLESGGMTLDLRYADLGQTVREVFERFLPLAEKHGIKLTLQRRDSATSEKISNLEFDPGKVELVLNNLISNALKFTPEGGTVEIGVTVGKVSTPSDLESIEIQVADNGIGISAESLGKVFERFYQVDTSTRAGAGTGIGLALSKELAELMDGGIRVESPNPTKSEDKGSVFTFWLPASPPGPASSPAPLSKKGAGEAVALVVEDNPELRRFIKQSIGPGWQVVEASDGEEGVQKAIELLPDLIISDVMMPRKDGFALCDELKYHELTAHIPIILLTAKATKESRLKGLRTGADDYLTKPFNTEELVARMENLVEMRRRLRTLFGQQSAALAAVAQQGETLPGGGLLSAPDREFLQKFLLTLEKNLEDTAIGVEDFAGMMQISRVQLHRKLKALTDKSATDFIRDYRLDRARAMLKNREGKVYEIASKVGFGDEKYFSKAFKEKFGELPSQLL